MTRDLHLTQEKLDSIANGESITVDVGFMDIFEIHPPCGDEHGWHAVDYRRGTSELDRRCSRCSATETIKIEGHELWDAVVNSEHVTEKEFADPS